MDSKIFEVLEENCSKVRDRKSWNEMAKIYGYSSGTAIRSSYRREKVKRYDGKETNVRISIIKSDYPKIAVFDIECSPMKLYSFSLWDQSISPDHIIQDSYIISWSGKLLNDSNIYGQVLTSDEAKKGNDYRIVKGIWDFLNECHILIGHNIKNFDLPKLNVRFLYHHLPPISSSQIIDTLLVAKQNFNFSSNRLSYLNKYLGITEKIENEGFPLWEKSMNGDSDALQTMYQYNQGDVVSSEDLYYKLRPFIKGHPNLALYNEIEEEQCPNCGESDLIDNGWYYTSTGKYQSLRCNHCGALSRKRKDIIDKDKKQTILRN